MKYKIGGSSINYQTKEKVYKEMVIIVNLNRPGGFCEFSIHILAIKLKFVNHLGGFYHLRTG